MDSQQKGKLLKKREHVANAGAFAQNENTKRKTENIGTKGRGRNTGTAPLATAEVDFEVDIRGLSIGDQSAKKAGKSSISPIPSPRRSGDRLTVKRDIDSGDVGLRSPVMRSRSLPVREMSASVESDKSSNFEEPQFSEQDIAAEVNQDWPLTGPAKNLHPYRRYSLPITPVCARGTEVFPGPRRNSLATTTLRSISRHYELFDTQKKIVEDEGEEGELTSPQGPFHLPSLLAQRREETVTPFGSL